jgi:hypothetical protein
MPVVGQYKFIPIPIGFYHVEVVVVPSLNASEVTIL